MTSIVWALLGIIAVLTGIIFSLLPGKSAEKKRKYEEERTANTTRGKERNYSGKRYVGGDGG